MMSCSFPAKVVTIVLMEEDNRLNGGGAWTYN